MRLKQFKIKNFRSYREEVVVSFGNMTAFVGKNDVGKSTILEAIDIFINEKDATVKYEKEDKNIDCRDEDTVFTAIFDDLPQEILIDATNVNIPEQSTPCDRSNGNRRTGQLETASLKTQSTHI